MKDVKNLFHLMSHRERVASITIANEELLAVVAAERFVANYLNVVRKSFSQYFQQYATR